MLQRSFGSQYQMGSLPVQDQLAALEKAFTSQAKPESSTTGDFEPARLLRLVLQYRWIIVAAVFLGLFCGLFYTKIQRPMYQSTSKVEIITSSAKVLRELEVSSDANDLVVFETARQKILSRDIAERVVERLNLAYDPKFLAEIPKFSLWHMSGGFSSAAEDVERFGADVKTRHENAVRMLRKNLSARLLRNTSILAITYRHSSPAYSRAISNAVADAYIALTVDKKIEISNRAHQVVQHQAALAKSRLEKSERALVDYADRQGLTVVGDNSDLIAENINEINKLLAHAVNERLLAERHKLQLKQNGAASLPQSFESNTVQAAKDKLIDLRAEYQLKLGTFKPGFPVMRKLRSQIKDVERSLNSEIRAIGSSVAIQLDQALRKEASLRAELRKLEDEKRSYQRKNIRYTILRREADSNRVHYQNLIKKLSELGVGSSLRTATASIVDAADFPLSPTSPRLLVNLLGGLMIFSMLAAIVVYAKEFLIDGFRDPEQLAGQTGLPNLGTIPHIANLVAQNRQKSNTGTALEDAYGVLFTAVQHTTDRERVRSLLVTSAGNGEGKSMTACRLAEDFARLGNRVLLLDANLRQPGLHVTYNADNTLGFANMLNSTVGTSKLLGCFKPTHVPNLTVLPAGRATTNPSGLLASKTMRDLLAFFSKTYDLVIVDSSPVAGFADSLVLSRECDATLFVVASEQHGRSAVQSALARLHMTGGKVIGTVFTMLKAGRSSNALSSGYSNGLMSGWREFIATNPIKRAGQPKTRTQPPPVVRRSEPVIRRMVA